LLKKHKFCTNGDIKTFAWFTRQPKSVNEIGWLLYIDIMKNKIIKLGCLR
jgi:hypothetical protein